MSLLLDGRLAGSAFELVKAPSRILELYAANLVWNVFLTSTALHAIFLITSPIQAVLKWIREKNSDSDTAIPYLCGFVGSILWLRYSIFINDVKLVLLQTYAVLMQTFFIFAMIFYRSKKVGSEICFLFDNMRRMNQRRLLRVTFTIFAGVFLLFSFLEQLSHDSAARVTGICASAAQIAGSFVCPYLIYRAMCTKVINFVPFAPVAFTWIMEFHAIIYSAGIHDFYLLTANIVFFCMDGCLLAIFFIYPTQKTQNVSTAKHV